MEFFNELGRLVERRWRDANYSEEAFPEISEQALTEADATSRVDAWEVVRTLHEGTDLPPQRDDEFSDLPIILYSGPRFQIDLYFWLDGTTSVHEHGFSGAFQVLLGSSIHSRYDFAREMKVSEHFSTGHVLFRNVEGLSKGDIRRILPGGEFIHSLFHLDRPSATITVRTKQAPSALPQFNYLKPYLAVNPFHKEQTTLKKVRSVSMLLSIGHPEAYPFIGELISSSDLQTTFLVLTATFENLISRAQPTGEASGAPDVSQDEWDRFHGLFKAAHRRHGQLVNLLPPVLGEMQRERALVERRSQMTGSEHRFFLALLLNVPRGKLILDLVKQRFPERDAADTICDWVAEFAGMPSPRSPEQNVLGIDGFGETHRLVLRSLLKGHAPERMMSDPELGDAAGGAGRPADLGVVLRSFRGSVLLKSLLETPPTVDDADSTLAHAATA